MHYGMFTDEGNALVERIAQAGMKLAETDGERAGWTFAYRELLKLAHAEGFGEATDTVVRRAVYDDIVVKGECEFFI